MRLLTPQTDLRPKNPQLHNSFVVLLSGALGGQLQSTNQVDASSLLHFAVFTEQINSCNEINIDHNQS